MRHDWRKRTFPFPSACAAQGRTKKGETPSEHSSRGASSLQSLLLAGRRKVIGYTSRTGKKLVEPMWKRPKKFVLQNVARGLHVLRGEGRALASRVCYPHESEEKEQRKGKGTKRKQARGNDCGLNSPLLLPFRPQSHRDPPHWQGCLFPLLSLALCLIGGGGRWRWRRWQPFYYSSCSAVLGELLAAQVGGGNWIGMATVFCHFKNVTQTRTQNWC